jgi:hypothetical protein
MAQECFDFRVVLIGRGSALKQIVDALLQGSQGRPVHSTFSTMAHFDVPVKDCVEASLHRVHLLVLDDYALCESYMSGRSANPVDLCVHVATESCTVADICEIAQRQSVRLLTVAVEPSCSVIPYGKFVLCDHDTVTDAVTTISAMLEFAHKERFLEEILQKERHLVRQSKTVTEYRPPALRCRPGATFRNAHLPNAAYLFRIALLGAARVGKSTFVAATFDDFVLQEYSCTRSLDEGTFSVHRHEYGVVNGTVYDGPIIPTLPLCHAVLIVVDMSTPEGVREATDALSACELEHHVKVVLGAKICSESSAAGQTELHEFARSLGAFCHSINPRESQQELLVALCDHLVDQQTNMRASLRSAALQSERNCQRSNAFVHLKCVK